MAWFKMPKGAEQLALDPDHAFAADGDGRFEAPDGFRERILALPGFTPCPAPRGRSLAEMAETVEAAAPAPGRSLADMADLPSDRG
jgi:hypothetical protein